jgi:hypothetical protein
LNRFGIGDGGTTEFLDNHKQQILYGKAGVAAPYCRLPIPVVVFVSDEAIIATEPLHDLVMPPIQFVRFSALAIEGGNRLLVLGP